MDSIYIDSSFGNKVPLKYTFKAELEAYVKYCEDLQAATSIIPEETREEKQNRIDRLLKPENYNDFFVYYFPHFASRRDGSSVDCAPYHIEIFNTLVKNETIDIVFEGHRGCAKSTHANIGYPINMMLTNKMKYMLLVGETEPKAAILLSGIQAELEYNQRLINDFGKQVVSGSWTNGDFQTKSGAYFSSLGLGQNPRGLRKRQYRPDYTVCDDLDNKRRCNNLRLITEAVEWIIDDLMECFDQDIRRFMLVNSRIHNNSILAKIIKALPKCKHFKVNAIDQNGNPTWQAKYTKAYWDKIQARKTYRSFQREYMNNPIESGKIFRAEYIQRKETLPLDQYESLVVYGDLSYKDQGDFKALKFWGKTGREFHRIAVFCRQTSRHEAASWLYDLYEDMNLKHYNVTYQIEGLFAMDEFVNDFDIEGDKRGYHIPVVPDKSSKSNKFDRIEAISGFWIRRNVWYNILTQGSADEEAEMDQLMSFEKGSNAPDDAPDCDAGAFSILNADTFIQKAEIRIGKSKRKRVY
ncbi:MAG: hypothetical protein NW226_17560 [Microscillaceae bacterium]|nr:hypothetical protein [Microscillaceae bacterium]